METPTGPDGGQSPPPQGPPIPSKPHGSTMEWIRHHQLVTGIGSLILVGVLAIAGFATFHAIAPASALLPGTPPGWTRLATVSGSQSRQTNVVLHGVQLQICWVVKGGSVASLSYAIGSPANGPTPLYGEDGSQSASGCLFDPGNDTGPEPFAVYEMGIGNYAVSLNEQLTPSQEAALNRQAAQQAQQQAQEAQQQAAQQQSAQQQQQLSDAEQAVNQAAQPVATALTDVEKDVAAVNTEIAAIQASLTAEQQVVTATQQSSAGVVAEGNTGTNNASCDNANGVQNDANGVQNDANQVQAGLNWLTTDLQSLQNDANSLVSAQQAYVAASGSVSGYTPQDEPSAAKISEVEAKGQSTFKTGTNVANTAMAQANQLVSQANTAAQTANNAGC